MTMNDEKQDADEQNNEIDLDSVSTEEEKQRAFANGWSDKDKWRGDPDKWIDAKTFLENGEKIRKIQSERNDRLVNEVSELRKLIVEQRDMGKKARIAGYEQALKDIEAKQLKAFEEFDSDGFKTAKEEEKEILKQIEQEKKDENEKPNSPPEDLEFKEWLTENKWFDEDKNPAMVGAARAISVKYQNQYGIGGRSLYDKVTEFIKSEFPHKFSNPRRDEIGSVESGNKQELKKKSGRTFDDLPDSAKNTFKKLQKQFKESGIEYKKEEYLSEYTWD